MRLNVTWVCYSVRLSGCHYLVYYRLLFVAGLRSYITRSINGVLRLSLVQRCRSFESILKDCVANTAKLHILIGHNKK